MSQRKDFTKPEDFELPESMIWSPDQAVTRGWVVQHDRMFFLALKIGLICLAMAMANFYMVTRLANREVVQEWFEFQGGFLVGFDDSGEQTVDGVAYRPIMLRGMLRNFVEARYGYDFRNIGRIDTALRYLSPDAAGEEQAQIRSEDIVSRIQNAQAVYRIDADFDQMDVRALGNGTFRVNVPGVARVNDALTHTDTRSPFQLRFNLEFVVQTVQPTERNPYGYVITETPRDILL